ncbi:hypothetical protein MKW92_005703 [Papaver armeniacum]|nr:hypothetical protein MKW92_005703 [Papaver armeniacum]
MARNFNSIFSTVFFFVMIIVASFTPQMAFGVPGMVNLVESSTVTKNVVRKPNIDFSVGSLTKSIPKVGKIEGSG